MEIFWGRVSELALLEDDVSLDLFRSVSLDTLLAFSTPWSPLVAVVVVAVEASVLLLDVAVLLGVLGVDGCCCCCCCWALDEKSFLENRESEEPFVDDDALLSAGDKMLVWDMNDLDDVADAGDMIRGVDAFVWPLINARLLLDVAFVVVVVVLSVTVLVLLLLLIDTLAQ